MRPTSNHFSRRREYFAWASHSFGPLHINFPQDFISVDLFMLLICVFSDYRAISDKVLASRPCNLCFDFDWRAFLLLLLYTMQEIRALDLVLQWDLLVPHQIRLQLWLHDDHWLVDIFGCLDLVIVHQTQMAVIPLCGWFQIETLISCSDEGHCRLWYWFNLGLEVTLDVEWMLLIRRSVICWNVKDVLFQDRGVQAVFNLDFGRCVTLGHGPRSSYKLTIRAIRY